MNGKIKAVTVSVVTEDGMTMSSTWVPPESREYNPSRAFVPETESVEEWFNNLIKAGCHIECKLPGDPI